MTLKTVSVIATSGTYGPQSEKWSRTVNKSARESRLAPEAIPVNPRRVGMQASPRAASYMSVTISFVLAFRFPANIRQGPVHQAGRSMIGGSENDRRETR